MYGHSSYTPHSHVFSPHNQTPSLFAYVTGSMIIIKDIRLNQIKHIFTTRKNTTLSALDWSHDNKYIACAEQHGKKQHTTTLLFNIQTGERIATLFGHTHTIQQIKFSPNNEYLLTLGDQVDKQIILWNIKEKKVSAIKTHISTQLNSTQLNSFHKIIHYHYYHSF